MKILFQSLYIVLFLSFSNKAISQELVYDKLTLSDQKKVIDTIISTFEKNYIFPEVSEKIRKELLSCYLSGKYKSEINPQKFAEKITMDLQKVSDDKHVKVRFKSQKEIGKSPKTSINSNSEKLKKENYGFKEVKIIDGNIGYLNLTSFSSPKISSKTADAALNFIWNTNAIIIDLRNNLGGDASMIAFIISRFLEDKPMILSSTYIKQYDAYHYFNALEGATIPRLPKIDIYVLVSSQTFSAAEGFAYILKNLKRATIIGEQTGGAANAVEKIDLGTFVAYVTTGLTINPITNTNWEKTGVIPDVLTSQDDALSVAKNMALKKLSEQYPDNKEYTWILNVLNKEKKIQINSLKDFSQFVGKYESQEIIFENENLYLKPVSHIKTKLLTSGFGVFYTETFQQELKFIYTNNEISGIKITSSNGNEIKYSKD